MNGFYGGEEVCGGIFGQQDVGDRITLGLEEVDVCGKKKRSIECGSGSKRRRSITSIGNLMASINVKKR